MNHFATRWIGILTIHTKRDPTRHITECNGGELLIRGFSAKNMHAHIMAIANPYLFFIGGQPDTMTWVAMSSYGTFVPPQDLNTR